MLQMMMNLIGTSKMIQFNIFHDKVIKFYPYRTARLKNWGLKIKFDSDKDRFDINEIMDIIQASGFQPDNHIVFCTEVCNFWWSDNILYVGGEVIEGGY